MASAYGAPMTSTWLCVTPGGLMSTGFMAASGSMPQAAACMAWARPISAPPGRHGRVERHVLGLERARRRRRCRRSQRQTAAQTVRLAGVRGRARHEQRALHRPTAVQRDVAGPVTACSGPWPGGGHRPTATVGRPAARRRRERRRRGHEAGQARGARHVGRPGVAAVAEHGPVLDPPAVGQRPAEPDAERAGERRLGDAGVRARMRAGVARPGTRAAPRASPRRRARSTTASPAPRRAGRPVEDVVGARRGASRSARGAGCGARPWRRAC